MIERLDYVSINGPAIAAMAKAKKHMASIDARLRAILELRISQINGCVYYVDLHAAEARKVGERNNEWIAFLYGGSARFSTTANALHLHGRKPLR